MMSRCELTPGWSTHYCPSAWNISLAKQSLRSPQHYEAAIQAWWRSKSGLFARLFQGGLLRLVTVTMVLHPHPMNWSSIKWHAEQRAALGPTDDRGNIDMYGIQ